MHINMFESPFDPVFRFLTDPNATTIVGSNPRSNNYTFNKDLLDNLPIIATTFGNEGRHLVVGLVCAY